MPTFLFTLTDSLIINQPCNYSAEQSGAVEQGKERTGLQRDIDNSTKPRGERESIKIVFKLNCVEENECERGMEKVKGDNKEPLKEQMKMSLLALLLPSIDPPPLRPVEL